MSVDFAKSETKRNLLRAFAGESQARNRYTFSAGLAKKNGLYVIEAVFRFTAHQEKEHAQVFYDYLEKCSGENIAIDGTYPIDLYNTVQEHLRAAQHNEYQEWEHDYDHFAKTAMSEGFPLVGKLFENIARVEKTHGDRFGKFASLMEKDQLFFSDVEVQWMCLHCGFVLDATAAPAHCPVCRHPQGYFVRFEMAPWS